MIKKSKLETMAPQDEIEVLIREAVQTVEDQLRLEDEGWINLSARAGDVVTDADRIVNLKLSRLYYTKDPLGRQAIRLWTDYTFGSGMLWQAEDKQVTKALETFWDAKTNQNVLSARGQRRSSDKLLVDGEVFFAIFLGSNGAATIRRIDPLEITEIITDQDDIENVLFYKRSWTTVNGISKVTIYRSTTNIKDEAGLDSAGATIHQNDDALVYHLAYNTITQRGNPLLLPALDWIRQYRRFLASRIAVMLALARFAIRTKVSGGQAAVDAIKAKTHEKEIAAGSHLVENLGAETTVMKQESGAASAYQDARMIRLQICSAVGIPEQYFGDISTGNLATAKTVELPLQKMFQSYQKVWDDVYQDIDEVVLAHNQIPPERWYVDRDFPPIAPADVAQAAEALSAILTVMPEFASSPDVQQVALMTLGIDDTAAVLDAMSKEAKINPNVALAKALRQFKETILNRR